MIDPFPWFDDEHERRKREYEKGRAAASEAYSYSWFISDSMKKEWKEMDISRIMSTDLSIYNDYDTKRKRAIEILKEEKSEKNKKWVREHTEQFIEGYHDQMSWLKRGRNLLNEDED